MEVAVAEEKKKIFRARKTMKISDRQQLESLHSTLSSPAPSLSNSSNSNSPSTPSPLTNGTHTEDRQKVADGETNDITDSKNSRSTTPVSPACLTSRSPPLALSLSLSASPPSPENPKAKEDTNPSPSSPFHNINDMLKQMEEEGKEDDSPTALSNKEMEREHTEAAKTNKKEEKDPGTEIEDACTTTGKRPEDQAPMDQSPVDSPFSSVTDDKEPGKDKETEKEEDSVAMETDTNKDHTDTKASEVSISTATEEKPSTPKASTMASSPSSPTPSPSAVPEMDANIKDKEVQNTGEKKKVDSQEEEDVVRKEEKMEVVSVKDLINEKRNVAESSASSSLSTCKVEKGLKIKEEHTSSPGQKRHLSDDDERNGVKVERDGKRQRVQGVELEAQLELKITANSGSRQKLEKFVHKMVAERLRVLQLTVFDQGLQELKDRVEKIDCATKHQSTLNTLQAKIARLAKKFGEANQASENKRKHEVLTNAKTVPSSTTTPTQRPVAAVVKQPMTTTVSTNLPVQQPNKPNPTTTAMVTPGSILQLIPTSSNSASLGTVTSQSGPTGTLLLKTTSGSNLVGQNGQPLLIQLPLSAMAHGGSGTLVNIPVSSFSTGNSLNKSKTTTPTTTYIIKASPTTSTMAGSATTMALQAISSTTQSSPAMSPAQMTLARAVYQGGAGGISTPSAGVSVTTARAPIQLASVPGVVSSSSSPVTSGPAATGSAAPGPPSGTVMTSKTDNQASSSTSTKTAIPGTRPKGSFIDLTEEEEEDDDDVLVTGVKKATTTTVAGSSVTQRSTGPPPLISTPSGNTTRASPQQSVSSPQLATIHYRPPLDSPSKARIGNNTTPTKASSVVLPPLPSAPLPAGRLPMEATQTSPPQQPQLKLARVQTQNGIVLSWCVAETDRTCAVVESYHLYAYHQESAGSAGNGPGAGQHWKKIGEVKALPLPMACTLTQFVSGSTYYFAVRARDVYGRFGPFCEPQCTDVISSTSS